MRIALIVDAYVPSRISAAVQMRDLAMELIAQGHQPTVLVPESQQKESWSLEILEGISVLRLRAFRTRDVGHLKPIGNVRRAFAEISLPFAMLWGFSRSPLANENWDGVVWFAPSIFTGLLVNRLKHRSECRAYLILRDIFPEWAVDSGVLRKGIAYKFLKMVEKYQYSVADVIGVQSPSDLDYMKNWSLEPDQKIEVLNNWLSAPKKESDRCLTVSLGLPDKFIFVYAGNMGLAQGMDCMIRLAQNLSDRSELAFVFIGRGTEVARLKRMAAKKNLKNIFFHGEVEPWEVAGVLKQCHVGLLALDPRLKSHNIPGKLLTYLQVGLPVLARINIGNDLEKIINDYDVGRVCAGDDDDGLQRFAEELIDHADVRAEMALRGKDLAIKMFSTKNTVDQLIDGLTSSSTKT